MCSAPVGSSCCNNCPSFPFFDPCVGGDKTYSLPLWFGPSAYIECNQAAQQLATIDICSQNQIWLKRSKRCGTCEEALLDGLSPSVGPCCPYACATSSGCEQLALLKLLCTLMLIATRDHIARAVPQYCLPDHCV
ncbi:unnamed protein product [Didymodactylos carnosus]|uniref:Uncharacterized protein n=1 Tax=Didymodactylos carnosus TaxID=1234261 RepID=A0A814THC1_9BILA|nr:unnamed protein product [Didymodactylos carnosus]CAF3924376.1 unnamed protein product [Didymodactylos carnosus]